MPEIESLYPAAFPEEDLLPLVRDLLADSSVTISLIASLDSSVVGNVIFTRCGIEGQDSEVGLLAPLAVAPAQQGKGIGGDLVRAGLQQMANDNVNVVCVLGDPAFYGRFGFIRENSIKPPYPLPDEWAGAWQSIKTGDAARDCSGTLSVPALWRKPELWS